MEYECAGPLRAAGFYNCTPAEDRERASGRERTADAGESELVSVLLLQGAFFFLVLGSFPLIPFSRNRSVKETGETNT